MKQLKGYENLVGDNQILADERLEIVLDLFKTQINFIDGFEDFHKEMITRYDTCISTAMNKKLLKDVDDKLGLYKLFKNKVYSVEDVQGKSKPDPAIFIYSAKQLEIRPENCIVIEDAPHGIAAAKAAGMYCIAITTTYPSSKLQQADQIVKSYDEIIIP